MTIFFISLFFLTVFITVEYNLPEIYWLFVVVELIVISLSILFLVGYEIETKHCDFCGEKHLLMQIHTNIGHDNVCSDCFICYNEDKSD